MRSKEDIYNEATLKNIGANPNGTRMDIIYEAMDLWAKEYHKNQVKENKLLPLQPFLNKVDQYVYDQENHIVKRSVSRILTIKAVAGWCKKFAEGLVKFKN